MSDEEIPIGAMRAIWKAKKRILGIEKVSNLEIKSLDYILMENRKKLYWMPRKRFDVENYKINNGNN